MAITELRRILNSIPGTPASYGDTDCRGEPGRPTALSSSRTSVKPGNFSGPRDAAKSGLNLGLAIPYTNGGARDLGRFVPVGCEHADRTALRNLAARPGGRFAHFRFRLLQQRRRSRRDLFRQDHPQRRGDAGAGACVRLAGHRSGRERGGRPLPGGPAAKAGLRQTVVLPVLSGGRLQAVDRMVPLNRGARPRPCPPIPPPTARMHRRSPPRRAG